MRSGLARLAIACVVLGAMSGAARAGIGIECHASESNVALDFILPLARDGSGNIQGPMQGALNIQHQKLPRERRLWSLDDRRPSQFWNVGGDLRIRVVIGSGTEIIDLVVEAQQRSGAPEERSGWFKIETGEGVRATGRIVCSIA